VFHVFVDGARDGSPAGVQRLADAIAAHYGLPPADLRTRLGAGRFRVKGNVDRATADRYVRDLERLGARCTIEPAAAPQFQSGLAAAFSGDTPVPSLGALEHRDATFSLSSVDGRDEPVATAAASAFAPPSLRAPAAPAKPAAPAAAARPASTQPATASAPTSRVEIEPQTGGSPDLFAPPGSDELAVELASDEAPAPPKRPSLPPAAMPEPPPVVAPRAGRHPLADERVRYVAGIVVAILLGFVPAHVVSGIRERSVYAAIDRELVAAQQLADTPDAYAKLDAVRAQHLDKKRDERRSIAIVAFLIWGVCGGAVAYAWFRKLPWDRFTS
jgi:hypothetical protein